MSLRDELQQLIRLQVAGSKVGHEAVMGAVTGDKAWGSSQAVVDVLTSYCGSLESAVLRLADEVEDLGRRLEEADDG
jgi:hypothetical protein